MQSQHIFNGFGIAYPYIINPKKIPRAVNIGQFTYAYINLKGEVVTREIPSYKAHNLILDTAVSVGILGLLSYVALWAFYLHLAVRSPITAVPAVMRYIHLSINPRRDLGLAHWCQLKKFGML